MTFVMQIKDRSTRKEIAATVTFIDQGHFFAKVQAHQINEGTDSGKLGPITQNWQFVSIDGGTVKDVIGASFDGSHLIVYLETEEQTRDRLKYL